MADDKVRIEWDGVKELEDELTRMSREVETIAAEEYTRFGSFVEEGARRLAPRLTGDLEASISFSKARRDGDQFIVLGGSNLPYALRQHEMPQSYNRGERTMQKPNWKGYQPGRKYLENAIRASEEEFQRTNERILQRILEGKR